LRLRVFSAFCLRLVVMQRKKELKMKLQLLVIFLLFGPLLADSLKKKKSSDF
jgi:hypothetical protein